MFFKCVCYTTVWSASSWSAHFHRSWTTPGKKRVYRKATPWLAVFPPISSLHHLISPGWRRNECFGGDRSHSPFLVLSTLQWLCMGLHQVFQCPSVLSLQLTVVASGECWEWPSLARVCSSAGSRESWGVTRFLCSARSTWLCSRNSVFFHSDLKLCNRHNGLSCQGTG